MKNFILGVLLISSVSSLALAIEEVELIGGGQVTYETPVDQVWQNDQTTCQKLDTCDLKKFFLRTQRWMADLSNIYGLGAYNYGDKAIFGFESANNDTLEKYGVVQMLRGCVFDSALENQTVVKTLAYGLPHMGGIAEWKFKNWVIDSDDADPLYNSPLPDDYKQMNHPSRLGIWRWNSQANVYDKDTESFFGDRYPPAFPQLYAIDRPDTAFLATSGATAKNLSIQFRVCLYKLKDIPEKVTTGSVSQLPKKPIVCREWMSSYIYNWQTAKFESPKQLDPFCGAK